MREDRLCQQCKRSCSKDSETWSATKFRFRSPAPTGFDPVPFDLSAYFLKRLDVRTIFGAQDEPGLPSFRQALALIAEGEIDMAPYVTHTLPLEQAADAFQLAREPTDGALKVSLTMDG